MYKMLKVPHCPEQAPIGARSSSTKNWGWAVTQRRCLNGSTILAQAPTLDAKLALLSMGVPNEPASSLRLCFVEASRQWGKQTNS